MDETLPVKIGAVQIEPLPPFLPPFTGSINIRLSNNGIVTVEGIKMSLVAIHSILHNPPSEVLFNLKRVDDVLEITTYRNAEEAAKFFWQRS